MSIYKDTISESLNMVPITYYYPDYNFDEKPNDAVLCLGGETTTGTVWINNGKNEELILKKDKIPEGFMRGRLNSTFNDSEKQREFALKRDIKKHKERMKTAWAEGKFNNRKHHGGRPHTEETKRRLSEISKNRQKICCPHCNKYCQPAMAKRWHFDNCKVKKNE